MHELHCAQPSGGDVALASEKFQLAEERFIAALRDARMLAHVEYELKALLGLAGVKLSIALVKNEEVSISLHEAHALVSDTLKYADQIGFKLVQADAYNLLAKLVLYENKRKKAYEHASLAKMLSSCGLLRHSLV